MNDKRASSVGSGKRQVRQCAVERIVSGGQTGADRAALDFAIEFDIAHGGWCPQGRLSEDGAIHDAYVLQEAPTPYYPQRTEWNVRDSDGTVIFTIAPVLTGGSLVTQRFAVSLGKPCLHVSQQRDGDTAGAELVRRFLLKHRIHVLNVAGPRASGEAEVGEFVRRVLSESIWRP